MGCSHLYKTLEYFLKLKFKNNDHDSLLIVTITFYLFILKNGCLPFIS